MLCSATRLGIKFNFDPREFFATRDRDIAEQPNMAGRNQAIQKLTENNPTLYSEYSVRSGHSGKKVQKFIHSSKRFPKTSYGRLNSAPLFAELSLNLLSSRGRVGIIVPTGIATDAFNQYFFADLVDRRALVSLYDFENREAVFQGVHRSYKFCLLTLSGTGGPTEQAEFAFFLGNTEQLRDPERSFALSAEDFNLFNPNTRTCPIFRTQREMEIARKLYRRAGVLWKEAQGSEPEVNPWGINFQLMFMMNTDSHLFRTREELEEEGWQLYNNVFSRDGERYLPLYEAKLFHQYDHRFATFEGVSAEHIRKGNARPMLSDEKEDPHVVTLPRYWIPEDEVLKRFDHREDAIELTDPNPIRSDPIRSGGRRPRRTGSQLALRKITNATNERTGIFGMIPQVGLSDSGTTIVVGLSFSEISHAQLTFEHQSS